jgi:SAM-dependent methyltransferase
MKHAARNRDPLSPWSAAMTDGNPNLPSAFWTFERRGWSGAAIAYRDYFGQLTTQTDQPLLDAVDARAGSRLLDVATGPGFVAAAALERGAMVVGVDFSATVVALARQLYPAIDFREGDAEDLAFADESFDAVAMNYGVPHLGRPERAFAETWRVLAPGGRFAFSVWVKPDEGLGFGIVLDAIGRLGNLNVPLPAGPSFFRFSEAAEGERGLTDAGFVGVTIATVDQAWRLPSPDGLFLAFLDGAVRTAALLRAQTPDALAAIREAVREAAQPYRKGDDLIVPMRSMIVSGTKT